MNEFKKARLRLTLWYVLISFLILFVFNLAAIGAERQAFSKIEQVLSNKIQRPKLTSLLDRRLDEFDSNFITRLLFFDLFLFLGATGASYFLSGRTLKPIQEMVRKQEEFSQDASHELRTPLTSILMEIEAIKRTDKKIPYKYQVVFSNIQAEGKRMKNIVNDLMAIVRNSEKPKSNSKINLSNLVMNVVFQMESLAKKKKIELHHTVSPNLFIKANKDEIKQVLLVILDNAIKYSNPQGTIQVSSRRIKRIIEITISDTGPGIDKEDLPHVFDRFYRGTNKEQGSGLGLTIAKQIVEKYKGSILISNSKPHGTVCTINLPICS